MTTALLTRNDTTREASQTLAASALELDILESTALIGRIATRDDQDKAVAVIASARAYTSDIEKARVKCKEPVLEFGRRIDDAAKRAVAKVAAEIDRVSKLLTAFQMAERARVQAAENARLLEVQRIERERQAELRRVAELEAETQRKIDNAEKSTLEAKRIEASAREGGPLDISLGKLFTSLNEEVRRQRELAAAQSLEARDAINSRADEAAKAIAPPLEIAKAKGQRVDDDWEIQIVNTFELMKTNPDLVRHVDFDMVALKTKLNALKAEGRPAKLPGVIATAIIKTSVRASRGVTVDV